MRRSLIIMLVVSVSVHAVALTVYFMERPALKPGMEVAQTPSLYISTQPQLSNPVSSKPKLESLNQPIKPVDEEKLSAIAQLPEPLSEKEKKQDKELIAQKAEIVENASPAKGDLKEENPITAKSLGSAFYGPSQSSFANQPSSPIALNSPAEPIQIEPAPPGKPSVVFLLDVSGSMYEHDGGTTRNDEARHEVETLISALPSGTIFTVVYYAERGKVAGPFQERNPAADITTSSLITDEAPECGGGTNFPVGLKAALALRATQIILITDGDLNMSLHDILANAPASLVRKKVGFKVVGIHPRTDSEDGQLLQSLADRYGGTYSQLQEPPIYGQP